MAGLPAPAASRRAPGRAKLRLRNDTFYDDYLHRGGQEPFPHMSYYDYGVHVRVVPGDPHDLRCNQYAFAAHHGKHDNYVQELREAPVVPYINGFTMPTEEKDAEANACFKQLLLRPHRCPGPEQCRRIAFSHEFCAPLGPTGVDAELDTDAGSAELSFVAPWRRFFAQQLVLAQEADGRLNGITGGAIGAQKLAVLSDTTSLRQWWLPEAVRGDDVHQVVLPLLCGSSRHATDNLLHGAWFRGLPSSAGSASTCDSKETREHMLIWVADLQEECRARPCRRMALPDDLAWRVLRRRGGERSLWSIRSCFSRSRFSVPMACRQLPSNVGQGERLAMALLAIYEETMAACGCSRTRQMSSATRSKSSVGTMTSSAALVPGRTLLRSVPIRIPCLVSVFILILTYFHAFSP